MGGVIDDIAGLFGAGKSRAATSAAQADASTNRAFQLQLWERQFGGVSDALKNEMMKVLGYTTSPTGEAIKSPTNTWLDQYKSNMRSEIEGGIRPSEEAARSALLTRIRSKPSSMSSQGYAKGLSDIVREGASQRGKAYREGMTSADLLPINMSLAFMNRQPFAPNVPTTYRPDYDTDVAGANLMGGGLLELVKAGKSGYSDLFGPRLGDTSSGFEQYMGDEGGNMGMGDLSGLEEGEVF